MKSNNIDIFEEWNKELFHNLFDDLIKRELQRFIKEQCDKIEPEDPIDKIMKRMGYDV